jgi:putative radical SAM enzyme (TIGR03279 family)
MPFPQVVAVAPGSVGERFGISIGDELASLNGVVPRDIIEYQMLVDEARLDLEINRGGITLELSLEKGPGEPLGLEVSSALFDRIRTCDNHCAFCFIYQLPKGMRKSLYVKDDDYRLSFLYGNFTTLTRFTELDFERVVTERLSPLYVSIHSTDPDVRASMLRNRRGATSLRWLRALLDAGIEVHGQIVVCPGVNDGDVLDDTIAGILERFPELATAAAVPLGVSRFSNEATMRPHTFAEANAVVDTVERWQERFLGALGRRLVYAADEYYLLTNRPFPPRQHYDGFSQEENGIGMASRFEAEFHGRHAGGDGHGRGGFFQSIDGAPASGYRAPRSPLSGSIRPSRSGVTILTGAYGARVLAPLLRSTYPDVEIAVVENRYFGGNIAVTGLMTGEDVSRVLRGSDPERRFLLPDVCLSEGRFLDGMTPAELPVAVEIIVTSGASLRSALESDVARPRRRSIAVVSR